MCFFFRRVTPKMLIFMEKYNFTPLGVFPTNISWSLRDSKFPQVSKTRLNIRANLYSTVVWMASNVCISYPASPCSNSLVTLPRAPITLGITVTFMFNSFSVLLQGPGTFFTFCLASIVLCNLKIRQSPQRGFLFVSCWISLGHVVYPRLGDPFMYKNPTEFRASRYPGRIPGCAYTTS